MALHACKECGQQISSDAKVCPHCGKKQGASKGMGCLGAIAGLILLGVIGSLVEHKKKRDTSPAAPVAARVEPDIART